MRKIIAFCLFLALVPFSLSAEGRIRERVYVSTDRDVYVAGDAVWLSAWCLDSNGGISSFSKIAYVEVHSRKGMVQTARIALQDGRGGGRLFLPNTLPTGNYRLFAYTKLGAAEEGFDPLPGSKIISVFNTFSTERAEDAVDIVEERPRSAEHALAGGLSIKPSGGKVTVTNTSSGKIGFSLSVRHDDGIAAPASSSAVSFLESLASLPDAAPLPGVLTEYEGEVISAKVTGTDAEGLKSVAEKYAFISTPGGGENVYSAAIGGDGRATFITSNVYGDQEMFLEIEGVDRNNICHLEIESPFLDLPAGEIPALPMSREYAEALQLRGLSMQLEHNFDADTLYSELPQHTHQVFNSGDCVQYKLDDYTRFPVMEELFIEFIQELRVRKVNGKKELQVRCTDRSGRSSYDNGASLVLLDGIPVLDHEKILSYDPLLVERVDIYTHSYFLGIRGFAGVVNFVTYQGTLPLMKFEDNVRIVDFAGCSLPLAYTCEGVGRDYPDYRQTIYWHPLLSLEAGESITVECKTPDYGGRFEVLAEGFGTDGSAAGASACFELKKP